MMNSATQCSMQCWYDFILLPWQPCKHTIDFLEGPDRFSVVFTSFRCTMKPWWLSASFLDLTRHQIPANDTEEFGDSWSLQFGNSTWRGEDLNRTVELISPNVGVKFSRKKKHNSVENTCHRRAAKLKAGRWLLDRRFSVENTHENVKSNKVDMRCLNDMMLIQI